MKLISMIEFVLEQSIKRSVDNWQIETEDYFNRCEAYANFLKQPLNLGMFVPCDLECNVLKQPEERFYLGNDFTTQIIISREYEYDIQQYEKAQEKVLFKNCSIIQEGKNKIVLCNGIGIWYTWTNRIVEDLIKENIELTESAIKHFDYEVN